MMKRIAGVFVVVASVAGQVESEQAQTTAEPGNRADRFVPIDVPAAVKASLLKAS